MTCQSVWPAATQTGNSRTAMMNLAHFGTGGCYPQIPLIAQIFKNTSAENLRHRRIILKLET
jgi:hypothetical protein